MTHAKEYETFTQSYRNESSVQFNKNGAKEFENLLPSKIYPSNDNYDNNINLLMRKNLKLPININENWGCLVEAKAMLASTGIELFLADLAEIVFELGMMEKAEHLAQQSLFFNQFIQQLEEKEYNLKTTLNTRPSENDVPIRKKEKKRTEIPYKNLEERLNFKIKEKDRLETKKEIALDWNEIRNNKAECHLSKKNLDLKMGNSIKPFDEGNKKNSMTDIFIKKKRDDKIEILSMDQKLDFASIKKKKLEINMTDLMGRIFLNKNQELKALEMFEKCCEISKEINDASLSQKYKKRVSEMRKKFQFLKQLKEVREDRDIFTEYTDENFRTRETLGDENLTEGFKMNLKQKYKSFRKRKWNIFLFV